MLTFEKIKDALGSTFEEEDKFYLFKNGLFIFEVSKKLDLIMIKMEKKITIDVDSGKTETIYSKLIFAKKDPKTLKFTLWSGKTVWWDEVLRLLRQHGSHPETFFYSKMI